MRHACSDLGWRCRAGLTRLGGLVLRGVGLGGWCVVLFGDGGEHGGALGMMRSAWVLLSRLGENPGGARRGQAGIHAVDR